MMNSEGAASEMGKAADAAQDTARAAYDGVEETARAAYDAVGQVDEQVRSLLRDHPLMALAGAVAAGFFVGRLVSRAQG